MLHAYNIIKGLHENVVISSAHALFFLCVLDVPEVRRFNLMLTLFCPCLLLLFSFSCLGKLIH